MRHGFIDCKSIAQSVLDSFYVKNNDSDPVALGVIVCDNTPSAKSYVKSLEKQAKQKDIGIIRCEVESNFEHMVLAWSSTKKEDQKAFGLIKGILIVNSNPKWFYLNDLIALHKRAEGMDCADDVNKVSCTARACMMVIESVTDIEGKNVVIVGYGKAVGKPLSYLLMRKHAGVVSTTHKYTPAYEMDFLIRRADIIVSAVGKPNLIKQQFATAGEFIPLLEDKIFIDAGISINGDKVLGDVDPSLSDLNLLTPVPGGIGPITSALILKNLVS